jgi:general secretion pathway protein F
MESGRLESPSEQAAFDTLRALGLTVVELREGSVALTAEPWWKRDIALGSGALALVDQAALAEQMATMFRVRLPVLEMLRILAQGVERGDTRARLERVARLVAEGMPLAEAFAQAGPKVAPVFLSLLRAGAQSDAMPEQLTDLARLLRLQDQLRGQVATALLYPAILIVAAVAVMLIVALTLAPALAPLFQGEGREMPGSLAFFLWVGRVITGWWPVILLLIAGGVVAVIWGLRQGWGRVVFRLPLFGPLVRDAALLALVRSLALMLKAGRPLAEALRGMAQADAGGPYAADLQAAVTALERGERAHVALARGGRLPPMVRELFRVGEEANALVPVLEALSQTLQGQLDQSTQRLLRLLTPILTLVIGGAVGVLVYSIMGAVLSINDLAF